MTVASGTSTPTSITVVATNTSSSPDRKRVHDLLALGRRHLAVHQAHPQPRQLPRPPAARTPRWRTGLDPRRLLDERADDEGPVSGGDLGAHAVPCLVPAAVASPAPGSHTVVTGTRPGGSSSSVVRSRSPKITMAAVRGIGVAVMTSRSGSPSAPLPAQRRPLLDAEAVLLVDHHAAQGAERHLLGQERVRADHDVDRRPTPGPASRPRAPCP